MRLISRRDAVGLLAAGVASANLPAAGSTEAMSLKEHAARRGLLYGAATKQDLLASNPRFADSFRQECGILVPEGELKWNALRPSIDTYNFDRSDWLLAFTRQSQIRMRGHTLVWHQALPPWFEPSVDSHNAGSLLSGHIAKVVGRYAGSMHSWDVVNEVVEPSDQRSDGLRNHPWLQLLGPGYIETAFHLAAEADPKALLVWNENNIEEESTYHESKRTHLLRLLEDLRRRGVPVHAVGIQSHLHGDHSNIAGAKFQKFLHEVSDLDLKILITEIDVRDSALPADPVLRDRLVAEKYYQYLSTVLVHKSVIAVLSWGLSDKYTWLSSFSPRADGAPVRPLPLDGEMSRTAVWQAISHAFDEAPMRTAQLQPANGAKEEINRGDLRS